MNTATIADFSLQAAGRYLQSAVFIDDNIYNQATANPDEVATIQIRQPKFVIQADLAPEKPASSSVALPPTPPFRTKDLVASFAQHGIVCALYEPERNFPTDEGSTVFKLCQTADLVVLDWDFHDVGVQGIKPKALIQGLINSGNRVAPHSVRLIAIYTNTPQLRSIANSLYQHLQAAKINCDTVDGSGLRLQAGSTRVVVLGKAGGTPRTAEEQSFTIEEPALAGKLLAEFASMNEGILPSCALLGMAAVRRNSRRILDKFRGDLDGQFLLHRALVRTSEEAFNQLPELLGDEFRAVIEDADFHPDDPTKFVSESSRNIPISAHKPPWKVAGKDCDGALREFWSKENGLRKVLNGKKAHDEDGDQPKRPAESLAMMCSVSDKEAHNRFAALLTVRTQYQVKHRDLGFGVIVFDRSSKQYSVCTIPPCDCLRLKKPTAFSFWRLTDAGRGNPVIVQRDNGELLKLVFQPGKPSAFMWMSLFSPDASRGVVTATLEGGSTYVFECAGVKYEWIAQLKPSQAQRIANSISQQMSRVGLTEAEWARMAFAME